MYIQEREKSCARQDVDAVATPGSDWNRTWFVAFCFIPAVRFGSQDSACARPSPLIDGCVAALSPSRAQSAAKRTQLAGFQSPWLLVCFLVRGIRHQRDIGRTAGPLTPNHDRWHWRCLLGFLLTHRGFLTAFERVLPLPRWSSMGKLRCQFTALLPVRLCHVSTCLGL